MSGGRRELDRLLGRGYLGGAAHERILADVLDATAAPTARAPGRRRRLLLASLSGAVLASAFGVTVLVRRGAGAGGDVFVAKHGARSTASPIAGAIDAGCGPSGERRCRVGETLAFRVNAALVSGYLVAYAEPVVASGALSPPAHLGPARIWYFPTTGGSTPAVPPGAGTIVLPQGIRIGPEHRPGTYRITAWLSPQPIARADADAVAAGKSREAAILSLTVER